ncbi:MAG: N-formylglutamate amidohydrolase [Beijerinckiaceae bacterium]
MFESEKPLIESSTPAEYSSTEPVETIEGGLEAGVVLICDHAANRLPAAYQGLGLSRADLTRHIAWDIGAAEVTRRLAARLAAPAVLTRFSRLLIDANRGPDDPTLVMRLSDGRIIPGNARIDAAEIAKRCRLYWQPYRKAIAAQIEAMTVRGRVPAILSVHSFTPAWKDAKRPWQVGILWDSDARLARPLIEALTAAGLQVGDNEPYDGALEGDTLDAEVTRRGLAGCLLEIRQDLIAETHQAIALADHLAELLAPILSRPEVHRVEFRPSRTGQHKDAGCG